ncbi:hypothetical protein [Limnohabitans sp.]|jgi:hypothetical protein|uniref:hypothetical protein n=1 Tax=Limnohabitans sp. TaxID=1907725 RepID=UPI00286ECC85|nr:hypothetical protein [Limnohabitans sp.]
MSIALFGAYRLLNPLQNVVRGFMPAQALQSTRRPLPLRVARVMEAQHNRKNAGRMVISGRMADVCAELDRLAELENRH